MKILMTLALMVTQVTDGDTFKACCHKDEPVIVRLAGVDCPEMKQPFGDHAKAYSMAMIGNKEVQAKIYKKDLYGRFIADVFYFNHHLNHELIQSGLAWSYYPVDKDGPRYESHARFNMLGLWSVPGAIPPWEWRKQKKILGR